MENLGKKGLQIALLLLCLINLATIPGRQAVLALGAGYAAGALHAADTPLAPPNSLRFDRISAADGLSFSFTTSILQDRQGFMWFGTRYGLNQFDGFDFSVHIMGSSGDVLFANYMRNLYQDRTGDLWVSNLVDLVRRDQETGEFIHYVPDAANPQSLRPGQIYPIAEDAAGNLWVGTTDGLNRYERSTDTFTHYLAGVSVLSFLVDRQGGTWLGTGGDGLWHYALGSPGEQEPVMYQHDPSDPNSLSDTMVRSVIEDHEGTLWVGTYDGGLNRLDRATGKFTRFQHDPEDPQSLSHNHVRVILEDSRGRLWIGTDDGLNLFDRETGRFFHSHYDPDDPQSLSSDTVWDLYEDRSGVLWIATLNGISKLNETASRFTHYRQSPDQPSGGWGAQSVTVLDPQNSPGLSDNAVSSVYQDRQGIVWIGTNTTYRGELNRLDRSTGSVTVYQHNPDDPASLSRGPVYVTYQDRAGTLWVGTLDGLNRFHPQTQSFEAEEAFRGRRVTSIVEDQRGALWVGYWGGLYRREPGASDFTSVPLDRDLISTDRVHVIYPDRAGAVWVSIENGGLFRLDPSTRGGSELTVMSFPQDPSDPQSPGAGTVMSFYEDAQDTLWMGSAEDGLVRFDRNTQAFTRYIPDALPDRYISCIQGDAQGFLWLGTELGLARFDPRRETFSYFDARDGLVIGEGSACFQNPQGEMLFGGSHGLNTFFPDQIRDNPNPPPVVFTALNLENKPLRTHLLPDEQITLSYRENYLSFDFAALDYAAPAKNQHAYRMEGLEADWVDAGTRRHADYPDLKPGTYTFRVKASNNSGVWNEQGTAVQITITPPFWQTWWFPGLLGVGFLGVIAGGVRLRLKRVEARRRELERQVADRTAELSQANVALEAEIAERLQVEEALRQSEREKASVEERNRLARELHDSVAQSMYGVTLLAEVASQHLASGRADRVTSHLGELKETARDSLAEMRLLIYELRPPVLEEEGLASALQTRLEAVESRAGLETELKLDGKLSLNPEVEETLFRIAQEALNNTLKHAHAHRVVVSLGQDEHVVTIEIADDGAGFDPAAARRSGGLGLRGMEERAAAIGARLEIESAAGSGARVRVVWQGGAG